MADSLIEAQPIPPHSNLFILMSNAYAIAMSNVTGRKVYEYNLVIEPSSGCLGLPVKVLSKTFVSRSIRNVIISTIIPQLSNSPAAKGTVLIEPNMQTIFTQHELSWRDPNAHSVNQGEFNFNNIIIPTDLIANLSVDITVKFAQAYDLDTMNHSSTLTASILHHQLLSDMLRYESVYFESENSPNKYVDSFDLISRHMMGISVSGSRRGENQTLVVINCSHSYITQEHKLIDLLGSFMEGRPLNLCSPEKKRAIGAKILSLGSNDPIIEEFSSILSGYKCRYSDFDHKDVNIRFHVTQESAIELNMDNSATVYSYFSSKGINLKYANLPCLESHSGRHRSYYPFELCSLIPGQKVPIFRLSPSARQHMTDLNKPRPTTSWFNSLRAREEIQSRNQHQFQSYGYRLSSGPVQVVASTLIKPILQFRNKVAFPTQDHWESGYFCESTNLVDNWCLVDTVGVDSSTLVSFFESFGKYSKKFGFEVGPPVSMLVPKQAIMESSPSIDEVVERCEQSTKEQLRLIMFIIDSNSTKINRLVHLSFDANPRVTATCIRACNILKERQRWSIYRSLVHKLNSRLGGTNLTYERSTWERLSLECSDLMIVGLDVTHPDNELNGVSIVGCAYTYSKDLFRHKSLVWPQRARKEIIGRMGELMERLLYDYRLENQDRLPHQIIIYRDGVSHEEFEQVRAVEILKASQVIERLSSSLNYSPKPNLSYIIAQKRHTMRFFRVLSNESVENPPSGTLIDQGVVPQESREFYLYSNTSPCATARPLHYHVLLNNLGMENLQKITYYLCFNFGKSSSCLSMPSSLRYAHNAAYNARNRVIASQEFDENKFYSTKFFC